MSDDYLHIIPEEPGAVPDADKREAAALYFQSIAPRADKISAWNKESLEFIDCGANFGRITCPSCGAEFEVDHWNDWMDRDVGQAGFTLTRRAMPCCGAESTLHDLVYEWPQGFARSGVRGMNPNIGKLSDEHMTNKTSSLDPRIIGFWKGIGGDYGLVNEYRSDGTVVQHVGDRASTPSPFRTEDDYVIYSLEQPNGSIFEQKTQYEISGDTLTFIYSPRKKMHFQRTHDGSSSTSHHQD